MTTAKIFGLDRHRLTTDGEGVTTLVAFNGCPLRCKYCLNKTSWDMDKGRDYTPEMLFEEVKIDQLYFLATHGGITFGGGEPLFETVQEMNEILDGYIVDIKDMNPDIYLTYTGKENPLVLKNLEWILQHGDPKRIKVRVPHIPEYNTDEDVAKSVERLKAMGVVEVDEFQYIIR